MVQKVTFPSLSRRQSSKSEPKKLNPKAPAFKLNENRKQNNEIGGDTAQWVNITFSAKNHSHQDNPLTTNVVASTNANFENTTTNGNEAQLVAVQGGKMELL